MVQDTIFSSFFNKSHSLKSLRTNVSKHHWGTKIRDVVAMSRYLISISGSTAAADDDNITPGRRRPLSYLQGMIRRDSFPSRVATTENHQRTATFNFPLSPSALVKEPRTHALAAGGNIRRDVREFHACHPHAPRADVPRTRFNDV